MRIYCLRILPALFLLPCIAIAQHTPVNVSPLPNGALAHGLDPHKDITHYIHRVWQTEQGLPQNSAQALCQTRDGYLWIGTEEGLVRFDGVRFTVFTTKNTPGLSANAVQALIEDREGALWIGTNGGGVSRMKDGRYTAFTVKEGLSGDFVRTLAEDRINGGMWIGTFGNGINYLKDGKITSYTTRNGLSNDFIFTVLQDHEGAIWAGTAGGGLNRLKNGAVTTFTTKNGLTNDNIRCLLEDHEGTLWIGTFGGGLNRLKDGAFTAFTVKEGLPHNLIWSLLEDREKTLWIGTFGGGISRLVDGKFTTFTAQNSLSSDLVRSLLEDREGNLWIGTVGGLNRLKDSRFTTYATRDGLSHDVVRCIMEDRRESGNLWIGTFGGGVSRRKDGKFMSVTAKTGLSNDIVYALLQDRTNDDHNEALWIGTNGGGLHYLHNGKITAYTTRNGLSNDVVFSLLQDRSGDIWVGTVGGGLNRMHDGKFTVYTTQDGLTNNNIRCMLEDHEGTLWIGTMGGGLNYRKNGTFGAFTVRNGLSNDNVRSLWEDNEGTLWIGTVDGGLNRLKNGAVTAFTTKDGLFDDVVHSIVEDDFGYLWMSCNKGIYRVRKKDLDDFAEKKLKRIPCEGYGKSDGMRSAECNSGNPAAWKDRNGNLWFATMAGAVTVNPSAVESHSNSLAPSVIIEDIIADSTALNLSSSVVTAAGTEKFELYYTATSLSAPERVRFKYMLEGYDKQWVEAGTRRAAYYMNLPRGRQYRFRVIACNNDGVWNESGAAVMLYLQPYFWETWWFYTSCVVCSMSLGIGVYRVRVRQIYHRAEELEKTVGIRTAQLRESNEEILLHMEMLDEKAHEIELVNTELRVKNVQLEALHREKNEFMGIAAHDLKNPLGSIAMNASFIRNYRNRNSEEWVDEQIAKIEMTTERMMAIITNLLDVNALESGNYNFTVENFALAPVLTAVIRDYQSQADVKQIVIVTEAPSESIVNVYADKSITGEILENLISNAVKYSPRATTVKIRFGVALSSAPNVESRDNGNLHAKPPRMVCRIEVHDEGPGVSLEDRAKLFGKFIKLSARPTGGEHSTGLGLFIVKKLVEVMNGNVWYEPDPSSGATFVVELPLSAAEE